MHKNNSCD